MRTVIITFFLFYSNNLCDQSASAMQVFSFKGHKRLGRKFYHVDNCEEIFFRRKSISTIVLYIAYPSAEINFDFAEYSSRIFDVYDIV